MVHANPGLTLDHLFLCLCNRDYADLLRVHSVRENLEVYAGDNSVLIRGDSIRDLIRYFSITYLIFKNMELQKLSKKLYFVLKTTITKSLNLE